MEARRICTASSRRSFFDPRAAIADDRGAAARHAPVVMEPLFAYLISLDRIPATLISRASKAAPNLRGRSPSPSDLPRLVLAHVRGSASDEDLWATWRFFTREPDSTVWLTGMRSRPDLNGASASIASFDADAARVVVKLASGELLPLDGRNLAWCPPAPADVDAVVAVLAKVINVENAERVCRELFCTRCDLRCDAAERCEVPHQCEYKRKELVGAAGRAVDEVHYLCGACGGLDWFSNREEAAVKSAGWCWEGKHTTVRMASGWRTSDDRRFKARDVQLLLNPFLQKQLDGMLDSLVSLRVSGGTESAWGDSRIWPGFDCERMRSLVHEKFEYALPNLKHLSLSRMDMLWEVVVNDELFPKLESTTFKCMPAHCTYTFNTSRMTSFTAGGCDHFDDCLEAVLKGSTALEEVIAVGCDFTLLIVESISLTILDLPDSTLDSLILCTPNLKELKSACWNEEGKIPVKFLKSHAVDAHLPDDHVRPPLHVNNRYSLLKGGCLEELSIAFVEDRLVNFEDMFMVL